MNSFTKTISLKTKISKGKLLISLQALTHATQTILKYLAIISEMCINKY